MRNRPTLTDDPLARVVDLVVLLSGNEPRMSRIDTGPLTAIVVEVLAVRYRAEALFPDMAVGVSLASSVEIAVAAASTGEMPDDAVGHRPYLTQAKLVQH